MHSWQLHPDTINTAELLVSEFVTNAIKASAPGDSQARSPERPELIALTLRLQPGRVVIEVYRTRRRDNRELAAKSRDCRQIVGDRGRIDDSQPCDRVT
jgi:hypothetical protein